MLSQSYPAVKCSKGLFIHFMKSTNERKSLLKNPNVLLLIQHTQQRPIKQHNDVRFTVKEIEEVPQMTLHKYTYTTCLWL